MASPQIRVGIIGYGLSAIVFHTPFIDASPNFHLSAVLQRSPPKSTSDEKHVSISRPDVKWVQTESDFFKLEGVDLIVISTPPQTHFALASAGLKAGKHVLVEKPFAPTSAEADKLIALAKESGKILTVFQNRRFDSDFLTVSRLLATPSPLGSVLHFESYFDRFSPSPSAKVWKSTDIAAGSTFDLGTHLIDQALVLFGAPDSVWASLSFERGDAADDAFMILLRYQDKMVILRSTMMSCQAVQPRFRIRGTKGTFVKSGIDPQEHQRVKASPPVDVLSPEFGVEDAAVRGCLTTIDKIDGAQRKQGLWESDIESEKGNYLGFYENLYGAIMGTEELSVHPEQARDVIKLIEIAKESSRTGTRMPWT